MDTSEPALFKLLILQIPNLISIFRRLCILSKKSVQVRDSLKYFVSNFLWWRVVSPTPNPQAGGLPLSAVHGWLFNIFAATLHSWGPFPPPATRRRAVLWWQRTHLTRVCNHIKQQSRNKKYAVKLHWQADTVNKRKKKLFLFLGPYVPDKATASESVKLADWSLETVKFYLEQQNAYSHRI
jgi:hypothetical protein